MLYTFCLYSYT